MVVLSSVVLGALSIIFGLLIIFMPRFLRYFVGGYFLIAGVLMLIMGLI